LDAAIVRFLTSPTVRAGFWLLLLAYVGTGLYFLNFGSEHWDYWRHLIAVRTLSRDLIDPPALYVSQYWSTHLYTPYHLIWASIRTLTGADIITVSVGMGVVNMGLFFIACRALARRFLRDVEFHAVVGMALLFFWYSPPLWSSVYNFGLLPMNALYAYWFAFPLALIVFCEFFEPTRLGWRWQAGFAVLIALITASHLVTGSFLLILLTVKLVFTPESTPRDIARGVATLGVALGLTFLWPYVSLFETLQLQDHGAKPWSKYDDPFYSNVIRQLGPAVLGTIGLVRAVWNRNLDLLAVCFLAVSAVYALNFVLEVSPGFSRYLVMSCFFLQMLLLHTMIVSTIPILSRVLWVLFPIIVVASAFHQMSLTAWRWFGPYHDFVEGTSIGWHSGRRHHPDIRALEGILEPEAVVMVEKDLAEFVLTYTDAKVVATPHLNRMIPSFTQRVKDMTIFFESATPYHMRASILERYEVDYLLVRKEQADRFGSLTTFWNLKLESGPYLLFERRVNAPTPD